MTAGKGKSGRGRENNEWTTDREETNSGTVDRRISDRRKGGVVGGGTSDRGNLEKEMEGQRAE